MFHSGLQREAAQDILYRVLDSGLPLAAIRSDKACAHEIEYRRNSGIVCDRFPADLRGHVSIWRTSLAKSGSLSPAILHAKHLNLHKMKHYSEINFS